MDCIGEYISDRWNDKVVNKLKELCIQAFELGINQHVYKQANFVLSEHGLEMPILK